MQESLQDRELRRLSTEYRWCVEAHARTIRFCLILNLAFAVAALIALKMDGPIFADAIAAGLFLCGFVTALFSIRAIGQSEEDLSAITNRKIELEHRIGLREGDIRSYVRRTRGITLVLF